MQVEQVGFDEAFGEDRDGTRIFASLVF